MDVYTQSETARSLLFLADAPQLVSEPHLSEGSRGLPDELPVSATRCDWRYENALCRTAAGNPGSHTLM